MPRTRRRSAPDQPSRLDLPDAPAPRPRPDGPARPDGSSSPDADLSSFLTELDTVTAELMGDADAVAVELHGATFASVGRLGDDGDDAIVAAVLTALAEHPTPGVLALALAVQATAEGLIRQAAAGTAARLVSAGVPKPSWADALAEPVTPGEFWRLTSGEASVLVGTFDRAGTAHAVAITVDESTCGEASMIGVVPAEDLAELDELLPGSAKETLDPAEFRWQVESALRIRQEHDAAEGPDPMDDEGVPYAAFAALLRTRLAVLPAPDRPLRQHGAPVGDLDPQEMRARIAAVAEMIKGMPDAPPQAGRRGQAKAPRRSATAAKGRPTSRRNSSKASTSSIYQIKVTLRGSRPAIWRRLEVPANISLFTLHRVLQVAFDWEEVHLHRFQTPMGEFGRVDPEFGVRADRRVTLAEVAPSVESRIVYEYDFGDSWEHEIVVEKILDADPAGAYPCCTGGRRAAPPEDSGGVWGYANMLDTLADAAHPDHEDLLAWLGLDDASAFDPDAFDSDRINDRLAALR